MEILRRQSVCWKNTSLTGHDVPVWKLPFHSLPLFLVKNVKEDIKLIDKDKLLTELGTPDLGHTRIKCALLSLKVLKTGYYSYIGKFYQEEE